MDNKKSVRFCFGTDSRYQDLKNNDNLDPNAVYFTVNNVNEGRLYVGDQSYNITVVDNLELGSNSTSVAPSVAAVASAINGKVNRCVIVNDTTSTTLPALITLATDTEYRYKSLIYSSTTSPLVLSIPDFTGYQFYSSIILSAVKFSGTIKDNVTLDAQSPVSVVRFLNGDVDLTGKDVVELLFFSNGLDICCIGTGYSTVTP